MGHFRMPAMAFFPRCTAFLPQSSPHEQFPGFHLAPVPDRPNMAVVQHVAGQQADNLIWLSGSDYQPPGKPIVFEQAMSCVLDEVVDWLSEMEGTEASREFAALNRKVVRFRDLLRRFEADTPLRLSEDGMLRFSGLRIDMRRAWVSRQAIWAELDLVGTATIDYTLHLQ